MAAWTLPGQLVDVAAAADTPTHRCQSAQTRTRQPRLLCVKVSDSPSTALLMSGQIGLPAGLSWQAGQPSADAAVAVRSVVAGRQSLQHGPATFRPADRLTLSSDPARRLPAAAQTPAAGPRRSDVQSSHDLLSLSSGGARRRVCAIPRASAGARSQYRCSRDQPQMRGVGKHTSE